MSTKAMSAQVADLRSAFALAGTELKTALGKGLTNAALIVERDYKVRLTSGGQVASGLLRASASHRLIDGYNGPAAQIGPMAEYGKEVELGGPPRIVPLEDILRWVRTKHLVDGTGANGRKVKSDRDAEASVAFLIQRSIAEKGTMPHPALLPALISNQAAIFKAIETPLRAELAKGKVSNAS